MAPATTLLALQRIIQQRKDDTSGTQVSSYNATAAALPLTWVNHWEGHDLVTEERCLQKAS